MAKTPRLTVRCEYPDMSSPPTEVTFSLSRRYGIHNARETHADVDRTWEAERRVGGERTL